MTAHDTIISAGARLFRSCVRLYPRRLRVDYGAEMEALFRHRMLRASRAGSASLLRALLTACLDVLAGAVAERLPRRGSAGSGGRLRGNDAARAAHGSRWLDALLLDSRFSLRMLLKHRGLTMVATFAMAVAIAVGATTFETISGHPRLDAAVSRRRPLRALQFVGPDAGTEEEQLIHEFAAMRGQLTTVEHFSAYRNAQHNLVAAETAPAPVEVAEITAFAFTLTNTPALLGRYLLPSDETDAASPVVVIGYQAWQLHFARDPNVVGRTVRLGGVARTVVGVMPEGFGFPSSNDLWIPLRVNPLKYAARRGPRARDLRASRAWRDDRAGAGGVRRGRATDGSCASGRAACPFVPSSCPTRN